MERENNIHRIKKRLLIETARLAMRDELEAQADRIPIAMFPKKAAAVRCCIYKSRAIVRYRLMAMLGHTVEEERDELVPLSVYAAQAAQRTRAAGPILTVIDEACSTCSNGRYFVTNACKGCVARSCEVNCPKQAVCVINGLARIDEEKCVNCGLCRSACPYHAIVYVPIPCEEACPVGAIGKDAEGREQIDHDKCIYCGKCLTACPFAAIMERSQIIDVIERIKSNKHVVAMLAPAVAGQFPAAFEQLIAAVKRMGFNRVVEVALGAQMTAEHERVELFEKLKHGQPFMTTSCCPAYVEAVERHLPQLKPYVSDTPTPMHYTARLMKEDDPDCVTVFIGPCIAKRQEALKDIHVDYVLTTEELGAMLVAADIELDECERMEIDTPATAEARSFAFSGGVTEAVKANADQPEHIYPILVDGLDKKALKRLSMMAVKGAADGNFIEVMCCEGGCVAGPCNISRPKDAARRIQQFSEQSPKAGVANA